MKKLLTYSVLILLVGALASCGIQDEGEMLVAGGSEQLSSKEENKTPADMTQEELRKKLEELGTDASASVQAQDYYEELLARDAFTEADYVELAGIYAVLGEQDKQRKVLLRLLRLYPSEEYMEQLSAIVVRCSDTDGEYADLLGRVVEYLTQNDAPALKTLVESEEWKDILQDGLSSVEIRTQYSGANGILQIRTGYLDTEITYLMESGLFYYYRTDRTGMIQASASYVNGAYNGAVTVNHFDVEGNLHLIYSGTLADNICVDEIAISYDGSEYIGSLNEDGTTAEKQENKVTEAGGVLYARSKGGNTFLYRENETVDSFCMDCAFLGLPIFEAWE